jgi:L-malate glycosyltransferase
MNRGGTEIQTLSLTKALRSCGHAVFVICYFEHDESIVEEFQNAGAAVRLLDMDRKSGFIDIIFRLRREIRLLNPDVVHVQYMDPGALPIIAAKLAGVKTVFATVHQPYTKSHGIFSKIILRTASLLTTRFIAVSLNGEKSWFGSASLFDENKPLKAQPHHFTVYNSVDTEKISKIASETDFVLLKREIGIPPETLLIGTVSRLRYEKGVDLLIEAFNKLIKEGIDSFLLIAGSGPDEEKLKNQRLSYGISDKVIFVGNTDWEKVIQFMSAMDIVVVPSRFEGFGLTAAEAMATGKPVIASDSFGLKEVVVNNKTGLIFLTNNAGDLAMKLKTLISSTERCRQFGIAGQSRAKTLFDFDIFRKKIWLLYNSLLTN